MAFLTNDHFDLEEDDEDVPLFAHRMVLLDDAFLQEPFVLEVEGVVRLADYITPGFSADELGFDV